MLRKQKEIRTCMGRQTRRCGGTSSRGVADADRRYRQSYHQYRYRCPNHILIEGDNLEALTALAYTHEGNIDVIYIDPPYNTGIKTLFTMISLWIVKIHTVILNGCHL